MGAHPAARVAPSDTTAMATTASRLIQSGRLSRIGSDGRGPVGPGGSSVSSPASGRRRRRGGLVVGRCRRRARRGPGSSPSASPVAPRRAVRPGARGSSAVVVGAVDHVGRGLDRLELAQHVGAQHGERGAHAGLERHPVVGDVEDPADDAPGRDDLVADLERVGLGPGRLLLLLLGPVDQEVEGGADDDEDQDRRRTPGGLLGAAPGGRPRRGRQSSWAREGGGGRHSAPTVAQARPPVVGTPGARRHRVPRRSQTSRRRRPPGPTACRRRWPPVPGPSARARRPGCGCCSSRHAVGSPTDRRCRR